MKDPLLIQILTEGALDMKYAAYRGATLEEANKDLVSDRPAQTDGRKYAQVGPYLLAFAKEFPGRCPLCAFHQYLIRKNLRDRDRAPKPHVCIEADPEAARIFAEACEETLRLAHKETSR